MKTSVFEIEIAIDNSPQHWLFVLVFYYPVFQKQYFASNVDLFYLKLYLYFF